MQPTDFASFVPTQTEVFAFLDGYRDAGNDMRQVGVTYLVWEYQVDRRTARTMLAAWMSHSSEAR